MDFKSGNFPPGLLNRASEAAQASWCKWLLGAECNTRRDFFFNLFFTGHGIWLLLPLSFLLLIVYRLVGPPEVDDREAELRELWEAHRNRFKSGAKRGCLKGVIKSSYLPEMGGRPGALDPPPMTEEGEETAPPEAEAGADGGDGWEDIDGASAPPSGTNRSQRVAPGGGAGDSAELGEGRGASTTVRPPPPRETVSVITVPGPTTVTIVGDRGDGPGLAPGDGSLAGEKASAPVRRGRKVRILTLHAAGHNHESCLQALEQAVVNDPELGGEDVVFYHVDTPGHEDDAEAVDAQAFSLEAQAHQLLQVVIKMGLTWFVGLGVGAGANVLLRFATDHPDKIAGLILANPSAGEAGRRERNAWLAARFRLSWESNMKAARDSLVPLSFPLHSYRASRYRKLLEGMHAGNVLKYIDASLCRDDITVARLEALKDVWILVLQGSEEPGGAGGLGGLLTGWVAGQDAKGEAAALMEKLRRASSRGTGDGNGNSKANGNGKATMVTLEGGGTGGGLLEARSQEALAAIKLFLQKCL